jgi:prepilin-type N-terminal cleavage/methylation domain-containing protein/prepilin-type processing-associated H-X9-DG protein
MRTLWHPSAVWLRSGFSLVELLVVIAIIGMLVALLMPAVQASREAARRAQCANNLKQMSLAFLNHENVHGHFPTGGWGYKWIGEPKAGYGKDQPGSWIYNILAYLEEGALRNLGSGMPDRFTDPLNAERQAALLQVVSTPVSVINCPSKRPLNTWPYAHDPSNPYLAVNLPTCGSASGCRVMRSDYRVNSGNINAGDQTGPGLIQDPQTYNWQFASPAAQNGISYQRSRVRVTQITDGTAKTAMIGEKYLNPERYYDGTDRSDDQCAYIGHDRDNAGYTANGTDVYRPLADEPTWQTRHFRFGSAHPSGFHMAFCDGSVHVLSYGISDGVWVKYGGRNDEQAQ